MVKIKIGENDGKGERDMSKKRPFKEIFLFTGLTLVLVLIFGGRHFGIQGISDLLNPLRSSNEPRPMVLAAGIQPMIIWKKIKVSSLINPVIPATNPVAEPGAVIEPTSEEVLKSASNSVNESASESFGVTVSETMIKLESDTVLEPASDLVNKSTPESFVIEEVSEMPAPLPETITIAAVELESIEPQASTTQATIVPKLPNPPLPYTLQLSSCRTERNAQNSQYDFEKRGLEVYLTKVQMGGQRGIWWRVFAGQYKTLDDALVAKKTLELPDAIVKKTPFANLIGEYASREELRTEQERLTVLGLSSYVLETPNNTFRLFVGAYTRKAQAEQQALELKSMGLISQSVIR